MDSLPAKPQRKPRNTGVGSLSLLQQIFPTQELNWGLLHCRQILYQLSYQGSLLQILFLFCQLPPYWNLPMKPKGNSKATGGGGAQFFLSLCFLFLCPPHPSPNTSSPQQRLAFQSRLSVTLDALLCLSGTLAHRTPHSQLGDAGFN